MITPGKKKTVTVASSIGINAAGIVIDIIVVFIDFFFFAHFLDR